MVVDDDGLRQQVERLLERVGELERHAVHDDAAPRRASRRRVLSGAALAGVAAAVAGRRPVAAGNGDPLTLGSVSNVASLPTGVAVTGADHDYGLGVTDNGLAAVPETVRNSALFGHARGPATAFSYGVAGYATDVAFAAVRGHAEIGSGGYFTDELGARAELADSGRGGSFSGPSGALQLRPVGDVRAKQAVDALDVNADHSLWWASGFGVWQKLAGPGTAGAFHPVTPGRVYDSRAALPAAGGLVGGGSRVVSVADRRNLDTGAVVEANFVPAGATAVSANVTVVNTVGSGFVVANPGGVVTVGAATVNWFSSGQILNNGVILKLGSGVNDRKLTLVAGGGAGASTDIVIDITGYWL
jgi:hypothetical protein